ncbi:hypothetical protein BK816_03455 [Boudabousia tangfeifanii]|uniref:Sensor histidine kinase MtrB n=1 Tax=Boudabousia tangfeifanii TaxID=1912795 RepID=A0A1D9MJK5_9ACTO|nr:hypothetical protein BK816_03455 [Boudabousia tangfeifanii]
MFSERVSQVEADATVRFNAAQQAFNEGAANTIDQAQQLANTVVRETRTNALGARAVAVFLLRNQQAVAGPEINDISLVSNAKEVVISPQLQAAVSQGGEEHQYWQSQEIVNDDDVPVAALAIGKQVNLPVAHNYAMYIVYSLEAEERTVSTMLRTVVAGSISLLLLLGMLIWLVTYRVLGPVQGTAQAARRLSNGDFDVRVNVRGHDELAVLARSFNNMAESLQTTIQEYDELSKLQQRFVSDVSHELRTPLTTIKMAGEMIYDARDDFDPLAKRSAELLHDQVERFDTMLADLLEISRYDAQAARPDFEFTDLTALTETVMSDAETLALKQGVVMRLHAPQYPVRAEIDEKRIERVIRNMVVNAIEHAESKPVEITIAEDNDAISIRVRDYGIGMTEEVSAHVFDRFYRADPARARTTGGTGLGLAIATEDVNLHDGKLEAKGEPGKGSAFMMTLPRRHGGTFKQPALQLWEDGNLLPKKSSKGRPAALPKQFTAIDNPSSKLPSPPSASKTNGVLK